MPFLLLTIKGTCFVIFCVGKRSLTQRQVKDIISVSLNESILRSTNSLFVHAFSFNLAVVPDL